MHVRDICQAIELVLEASRDTVHNQILNVGDDGQNYQIRHIAQLVADAFPGCVVTFGAPSGDMRSYRVSFKRIRRVLPEFACRHDAEGGARELREVFARIGLTRETFEFRAFTRLSQLRHLLSTGRLDADCFWRTA